MKNMIFLSIAMVLLALAYTNFSLEDNASNDSVVVTNTAAKGDCQIASCGGSE